MSQTARHMGLVHGKTTDGKEIDAITLVRFASYSKRGRRDRKLNEPNQPSEAPVGSRKDEPAKYRRTEEHDSDEFVQHRLVGFVVRKG